MKIRANKLIKYIFLLYIFLVLSLPDGMKNLTCLYKMSTRGLPILYTYNYYFSFLEVPIIIIGLLVYKNSSVIRFMKLILAVLMLNVFFAAVNQDMNIFAINSYEMFLLLLTGFATASIVLWVAKDFYELEKIIDCFIILQFLLQLVSMVSGSSGADGRYSAIGMGSGATASLAAAYLVWTFFCRTSKVWWPPVICSLISIGLSGSRANMLAFAFIAIVFSRRLIQRLLDQGNKRTVFILLLLGLPLLVIILVIGFRRGMFSALSRVGDLFQGSLLTNVIEDGSYIGRVRSIQGSFNIIKKHPIGIPFSIYAIEYYSSHTFSMEYPHSTLLSYILLWSPFIAAFCVIYLVRLMVKCSKEKMDDRIYLLYYLVMIVLYGSPILYSKVYAFDLVIISFIMIKIKKMTRI